MNVLQQGAAQGVITGKQSVPEAPRTIASALSRMEVLNGRLETTREHLARIASALGAIYPITADDTGKPITNGAVGRLNDAADVGHSLMNQLESVLSALEQVLG